MVREELNLFKDFHYKEQWNDFPYIVEFKGDKARVISTEIFSIKKCSRFNKLHRNGSTTSGNHYSLTVNGYRVYFISKYQITLT